MRSTIDVPNQILAEIMIHSSLKHPNVVRMEDTFEDDEHVYFRLELCKAGVSCACERTPSGRLLRLPTDILTQHPTYCISP